MAAIDKAKGKVVAAQGNLLTVKFEGIVRQNEVVFVKSEGK